ncbi:hypothetical protein EMCRGX_G027240 [Ephydatia muelleri]
MRTLLKLTPEVVNDLRRGLNLTKSLNIPPNCMINLEQLIRLANVEDSVTPLSYLWNYLDCIVGFITTTDDIVYVVTILRARYEHWISTNPPSLLKSLSIEGTVAGAIQEGIIFVEKLCDILRQNKLEELCCSEGLCWLRLLLKLVDVTTPGAEEHLMKLFAKGKTMNESHHVHLTNYFAEDYLSAYKITPGIKICDGFISEVTDRHSGANNHHFLLDFIKQVGAQYVTDKRPRDFILDLLKINVPMLFALPEKTDNGYDVAVEVQSNLSTFVQEYIYDNGLKKGLLPRMSKMLSEQLDDFQQLMLIVLQKRALHVRVLRRDVARFAKEIITNPSFKASPGWISRFMRRHKFVTRVKTTAGQSLPKNVSDRIVDYVTTCSKRIRRNQLPLPCIANMDETAIWADMPGNSTIEVRGAHTVQISTTGHDKQRITICLAAFADGTKLKPFVVFKGKRIPKEISNVHAAVIKMSDNGWMNEDLTMEWIATVWNDSVDPGSAERMLVWDTFKCHFTSSVKSLLEESNTDIVAVPGGCTKILQPADVSWNALFKARYRDLYTAWMSAQNHERTKAGNLRAPSKALMVDWVLRSWESLSSETIRHSFDVCGVTSCDQKVIHYTKEGGLENDAHQRLVKFMQSPPDADDSEEDESEVDDEWSLTQGSDNEDGLDGVEDSEDEVVDSHEID